LSTSRDSKWCFYARNEYEEVMLLYYVRLLCHTIKDNYYGVQNCTQRESTVMTHLKAVGVIIRILKYVDYSTYPILRHIMTACNFAYVCFSIIVYTFVRATVV